MCPFCIGAAAWAVTGLVSTAGGLGVLATVVQHRRAGDATRLEVIRASDDDAGFDLLPGEERKPTSRTP